MDSKLLESFKSIHFYLKEYQAKELTLSSFLNILNFEKYDFMFIGFEENFKTYWMYKDENGYCYSPKFKIYSDRMVSNHASSAECIECCLRIKKNLIWGRHHVGSVSGSLGLFLV